MALAFPLPPSTYELNTPFLATDTKRTPDNEVRSDAPKDRQALLIRLLSMADKPRFRNPPTIVVARPCTGLLFSTASQPGPGKPPSETRAPPARSEASVPLAEER